MKTYKTKIKIGNAWGTKDIFSEIELSEQEVENLIDEYMKANGGVYVENITPTHKRKYFVPKVGEEQDYWYLSHFNRIEKHDYPYFDDDTPYNLSVGNCFATEQDAQDELNRRQAKVRLWNNYDDKYHWDIDWENQQQKKYYIAYNHMHNDFETSYCTHDIVYNTELPYFKSAEDRNQFVKENESDLLKILNIKK